MTNPQTFEIDGADVESLDGFFDALECALAPGVRWGRNYNALHDVLFGGVGTPRRRLPADMEERRAVTTASGL